jgi:hypothetical protein
MEVVLTKYIFIESLYPLRILSYEQDVISFIQGPYFNKEFRSPDESMYFSNFNKILLDRKYKQPGIDELRHKVDLYTTLAIVGVWDKLCSGHQGSHKENSFVVNLTINL